MKSVKFNDAVYEILSDPNVTPARFQCTIVKGEHSIDAIAANTVGVGEIRLLDEQGETIGIYNGYTDRIAVTFYHVENTDVVSVELENANIQAQILALSNSLNTVSNTVQAQGTQIASQNTAITDLGDEVATQNIAISDLGDTVSELDDTNTTQDLAIEDLAEAISEIVEE